MSQFRDMAEHRFGYGIWRARYWLVGPEEDTSENESKQEEELAKRHSAWRTLGSLDLDDSLAFHQAIGDLRYHREKPKPQHTWTRLISVLAGYGADGVSDRHTYQRKHWGRHPGDGIEADTCVIELSGIAAKSQGVQRNRDEFFEPRLRKIAAKLRENKPELLVLYGKSNLCQRAWLELTSGATHLGQCSNGAQVRNVNGTIAAWTEHTNARGSGRTLLYWQEFGKELRAFRQKAAQQL